MEKKLSFIVPVYKCEPYLDSCLESIYGAGVEEDDFEVILVDDGSPDNSAEICRRWVAAHANIVYVDQENQGASTARNTGLRAARGEWIWFVDSDDEVVPEFFAAIMPRLQDDTETELFFFNYCEVYADHETTINRISVSEQLDGKAYFQKYSDGYLWNKLYRRSALRYGFLDGTKNIEDAYFNLQNLQHIAHIQTLTDVGYRYHRVNMQSTQFNPSRRNKIKLAQDTLTVVEHMKADMDQTADQDWKNILEKQMTLTLAGHFYALFLDYSPNRIRRTIKRLRPLGLYPLHKVNHTRKMDLFRTVANMPWLFIALHRLRRKCYFISYRLGCSGKGRRWYV